LGVEMATGSGNDALIVKKKKHWSISLW